ARPWLRYWLLDSGDDELFEPPSEGWKKHVVWKVTCGFTRGWKGDRASKKYLIDLAGRFVSELIAVHFREAGGLKSGRQVFPVESPVGLNCADYGIRFVLEGRRDRSSFDDLFSFKTVEIVQRKDFRDHFKGWFERLGANWICSTLCEMDK